MRGRPDDHLLLLAEHETGCEDVERRGAGDEDEGRKQLLMLCRKCLGNSRADVVEVQEPKGQGARRLTSLRAVVDVRVPSCPF